LIIQNEISNDFRKEKRNQLKGGLEKWKEKEAKGRDARIL